MKHRSFPPALVLGDEGIGALAHRHMAMGALKGVPQVVVDCGGHFDPYAIAKEARGVGRSPANVLERVIVARAFTAYQEITLLLRLRREYTVDHRIFLLNPLDLFVDPDLPHGDGLWIFGRLHAALHHFHETGYRLFLFQRHQAETSLLFQKLCRDWPHLTLAKGLIKGAHHGKKRVGLFTGGGHGGKLLRRVPPGIAQGRQAAVRQAV